MKKSSLKKYCIQILMMITFCCFVEFANAYESEYLFDSLFPDTWYSNSYRSLAHIFYEARDFFESVHSVNKQKIFFDKTIHHIKYAYFCVEKMYRSEKYILRNDIIYLSSLVIMLEGMFIQQYESNSKIRDQLRPVICMVRCIKNKLH